MENGASTTSGHAARPDNPLWFRVPVPTQAQVDAAVKVGLKVHSGGVWHWWLKFDKDVSHLGIDQEARISDMSVDDRVIKAGKEDHFKPALLERERMKTQGERALHKFVDGMDATNAERASQFAAIRDVLAAVEYGDLPAAIQAALSVALPGDGKDRLVELLEDEMIYWPDYQRTGSTSADRTIAHHIPAGPTNSGTSITISGSQTVASAGAVSITEH